MKKNMYYYLICVFGLFACEKDNTPCCAPPPLSNNISVVQILVMKDPFLPDSIFKEHNNSSNFNDSITVYDLFGNKIPFLINSKTKYSYVIKEYDHNLFIPSDPSFIIKSQYKTERFTDTLTFSNYRKSLSIKKINKYYILQLNFFYDIPL